MSDVGMISNGPMTPPPSDVLVMVMRAGLDGACLGHFLQTCGIQVQFILETDPTSTNLPDARLILIEVDERMNWRAWFSFLKSQHANVRLAALVSKGDRALEAELIQLGASCILARDLSADIAVAALQLAAAGGFFVPPEAIKSAYRRLGAETRGIRHAPDGRRDCAFTNRELAVVSLLRRGLQNKNIAHELLISESTVKVHLRNLMKKLGASNRTEVAFLLNTRLAGDDGA